jgi:hypothetical protein
LLTSFPSKITLFLLIQSDHTVKSPTKDYSRDVIFSEWEMKNSFFMHGSTVLGKQTCKWRTNFGKENKHANEAPSDLKENKQIAMKLLEILQKLKLLR